MHAEWTKVIDEWTDEGPWSAWSRWELWHLGDFGGDRWVRYRKRNLIHHTQVEITQQDCRMQCPPEYQPLGSSVGGCESVFDRGHYALPYHAVTTTVRTETQDETWDDIQWYSQANNPYLVQIIQKDRSWVHAAGSGGSGSSGMAGANQFEVATLPALCEGDRLTLSRSGRNYTMIVDGYERSPRRALEASKLGVGFHLIEITAEVPEDEKQVRVQLPLSVISPVELKFPPITNLKLKGNTNGGIVKLRLHNRSRSDHAVRIEPDSMPPGWMALRLGNPILVLKPAETVEVDIQVERMVVADVTPEPLPFSVRVFFPGTDISDATAMFYVIAEEVFGRGKKPKRPPLETF